jgi:hypothetical protein
LITLTLTSHLLLGVELFDVYGNNMLTSVDSLVYYGFTLDGHQCPTDTTHIIIRVYTHTQTQTNIIQTFKQRFQQAQIEKHTSQQINEELIGRSTPTQASSHDVETFQVCPS